MATRVSLHNQHFWTPPTHIRVKNSGSKGLSAHQQGSSSPDSTQKPSRIRSSRSSGHVPDDQTAKSDEIISISSDGESDLEDDCHDDESQKRVTHVSNRSTPGSMAFQGSTKPACQKSPSMSTWDECTRVEDNQEASDDAVCLGRIMDTAHASPSPRARSVVGAADADREQSPASAPSPSERQSYTALCHPPTRQIEKAPADASLSPGLLPGNGDGIYTSGYVAAMVTGPANIADNPERAQPGDALPSVEALAASAKGLAGDTNGVGKHNGESSRDDSHEDVGAPSSLSVPAYQEACRSRSPVSAESTTFSPASPFHSPLTPGSTRASTLAVSQKVNRSLKSPSYDLEPMRISSSGFTTDDGMNTPRDPSPVQSQLPDGSEVEPNISVQINNITMEARSSLSPARRRTRPTTLNEESHWGDSDDSHGRDGVSSQSDTEYYPLSTDDESEGNDHQDSDEDKGFRRDSRKRRKFGNPSARPRSPSKQNGADTSTREHRPRDMLPSATSPPSTDDIDGVRAEFEEWALQNVRLKRTIVNDRATFQLQFDWDLCVKHGHLVHQGSKRGRKRGHSARARFTQEEDCLLIKLKEELELPWADIHARFTDRFAWRSKEALQVRYCTKLKCRG